MRWQATILYRADHATVTEVHTFDEIVVLQTIIEAGPHWDTIIKIEVVRTDASDLTLEQAEAI